MNCLPVTPDTLDTPAKMDRYFADLARWNFDVPYNAFYAFPMSKVTGEWKPIYIEFARRARALGLPACVQIQSTVGWGPDVGWEENAQYYADNTCDLYDHHHYGLEPPPNFFASFASPAWRAFLKNLISLFREWGYNWLVLEEPMQRCDIPGTKDPLHRVFRERHPHLPYPLHATDSAAYYTLQRLKRDVLIECMAELTAHARAAGFEMIGCMPWFFTPTHENTPAETWNTGCDQGRLAALPHMDFLVTRMQPDNLFAEATIAEQGEALPRQAYVENLAHHFGKPIVAVNNPTNEHIRPGETETLIPYDFFAPYTLAAAAASPNGQTRHWYGKHYEEDSRQMNLMAEVNALLPRLGTPRTPWAVVFSYAGADRLWPRGWRQSWRHLYYMISEIAFKMGTPLKVLYGESLREGLAAAPELKLIFLLPWFPLPPAEREALRAWVAEAPDRRLVMIGAHKGYTWPPEEVYFTPRAGNNELVDLFGLDPAQPLRTRPFAATVRLATATPGSEDNFWGDAVEIRAAGYAALPLRDGADVEVLYRSEDGEPVVAQKRCGPAGGRAIFVGVSLDAVESDFPLGALLSHCDPDWDCGEGGRCDGAPVLVERPGEALWSVSGTGFLVIANTARRANRARLNLDPGRVLLWDIAEKHFIQPGEPLALSPHSIRCLRLLGEGQALLDARGQIFLDAIEERPGAAVLRGYFTPGLTVWSTKPVACATGESSELSIELRRSGVYNECLITNIAPGRGEIIIHWG